MLQDTIGGQLCNETKSLEVDFPYVSERDEEFYAISLDIKNKKSIEEALDLFIKPDQLEGDNKYHCDKYDMKLSAQRRSYIKKLSNTVIINLKRFEYDFNRDCRIKINEYCEFPTTINFKKWSKDGIIEESAQEDKKEKSAFEEGKEGDMVDDIIEGKEEEEDDEEEHIEAPTTMKKRRIDAIDEALMAGSDEEDEENAANQEEKKSKKGKKETK